jgi:hypothetical protein
MQINVGIQLAKLISNKFSHNLLKIIIINPTIYISLMHNALKPFLSDRIKQLIIFNDKYKDINDIFDNEKYK